MRFLFLLLMLAQASFAQENLPVETSTESVEVNTQRAEKPIPKGFNINLVGLNVSHGKRSNYEASFGYTNKSNIQYNFIVGSLNKGNESTGGSLKEWEYVEQSTNMQGAYYALEVKKLFYETFTSQNVHGFFASGSLGLIDAKFEFNYNRYKPYNGFICLIGDCDKTVEESDSGAVNKKISFSRIGIGYTWELRSPRRVGVVSLIGGVNYTRLANYEVISVNGLRHGGSFNTNDVDTVLAYIGAGVTF